MSEVLVRPLPVAETRQLRQAILRPHETVEQMAARERDDAFAVGAFDEQTLVSVGMVLPTEEPGAWRVRGMATDPDVRGRGFGSAVLAALVQHAAACGAQRIWLNARTPARSFYERAGFRVTSEEFQLPAIGPHVVMERPAAVAVE